MLIHLLFCHYGPWHEKVQPAPMSQTRSPQLVVALDVGSVGQAVQLVDQLKSRVSLFKVGLQLFANSGPEIIRQIRRRDCGVFLDLKLHDIPNTVASASIEAAKQGVELLTIHTLGGSSMMSTAREALDRWSRANKAPPPGLLGVTVLTSMEQQQLDELGLNDPLDELVARLAKMARQSGMKGIVCSAQDLRSLDRKGLAEMLLVTPGIRPSDSAVNDQARTMTPGEAVRLGADYLVVGRPIISSPQPLAATIAILAEMEKVQ